MATSREPRAYIDHELIGVIFGFLPTHITDYLYDSLNVIIYNIMEGINARLIDLCPEKEAEIAEAIRRFEVETDIEMDQVFNTFQQYIFNSVYKIPDNLDVIPDYIQDIDISLVQEHEDEINGKHESARQEFIAQVKLQHFYKKQLQEMEKELSIVEEFSDLFSFFSTVPEKHNINDVETSMKFVATNFSRLKSSVIMTLKEYPEIANTLNEDEQTKFMRETLSNLLKQQLRN